jgi:minor extracellular serine protease Vpr
VNRRSIAVAFAASAMVVVTAMPAAVAAAAPTRHIGKATIGKIDPSFRPFLADSSKQVTAVLQLSGDPAVALPKAQQKSHAASMRLRQSTVEKTVRADGGRVIARYQYAYNGIKVRATGVQLAKMAELSGVVAVRSLPHYTIDNTKGVPYIGAPAAWTDAGATGTGETVAVIDTGIDYTHANFGGAGTEAAFSGNDSTVIEPGSFPTAKVVAGYDFAGNGYDAEGKAGSTTPTPDPDPLDCAAHGSHVSGTIAGDGVKADHTTFTGPYNSSTLADPSKFVIGPGVAPDAKLVALKVFGCDGSTDLVVDALEWVASYNVSHADGIDVVNMSLGSPFGDPNSPDAVATNNLVATGVVVVASAGNESSVPYITGAPAAATSAISVAALDAFPTLPMAKISGAGAAIPAINQNDYPALPLSGKLHVLANGSGGVKLGCTASDYDAASAGKIVAVKRGVCTFVEKGQAAENAGAIGIIVINRDDTAAGALPTYIGYSPDYFSIPMIGTDKTAQTALLAGEGNTITLASAGTQPNPTYQQIADFSSSGPRWGDSWLKPDVAAPGVNIFSTLVGSGWNGTTLSGTSMASPMTAGTAALVRQTHPNWSPLKIKAALVNTADATGASIATYSVQRAGSGVIQADRAVNTKVVATTSDKTASLNFGYEQADGGYFEFKTITISNSSSKAVTYKLDASSDLVSIWPSTVRVRAHDSEQVLVRASLTRAQVAALPTADKFLTGDFTGLTSFDGVVTATPTKSAAGVYSLRVPYLLVPRGLSDVSADQGRTTGIAKKVVSTSLNLRNDGVHSGNADVYALGVTDPRGDGADGTDVRAVGVQSIPAEVLTGAADPNDRGIQFAINLWDKFSSASPHEYDVAIDTNNDGTADYYVVGYDNGNIFAGAYDGVELSLVFDADFNLLDAWYADAPANGSTLILPLLASDIGLTADSGSFTYSVAAVDGFNGVPDLTGDSAPFDAFKSAQSTGAFVPLDAHSRASVPVTYNLGAGVRGWMVVTLDDRNGASQADLVRLHDEGHGHH